MKISFTTGQKKTRNIYLPAKLGLKFVCSLSKIDRRQKKEWKKFIDDSFQILKRYKKTNGSWNLLEVEESDRTIVVKL